MSNVRIVSIESLGLSHVGVNHRRILTMRHDGHGGGGEDSVERLSAIDEHISCGSPHKEFYSRYAVRVETCEEVGIVVGSPKEERVVYNAISSSDGEFLFQCLQGGCLWHGVWHVEEGGDATGGSCTALGSHVCLLRQSWLAEVYVVVDDAGQ